MFITNQYFDVFVNKAINLLSDVFILGLLGVTSQTPI